MLPAERRQRYMALAQRRIRPSNSGSLVLPPARASIYPAVDLRAMIKQTPFIIVGDLAIHLYMPARTAEDLDILVLPEDAPALYRELALAGCRQRTTLPAGGTIWALLGGALLAVIESDEPWARAAIHEPMISATGLPTIGLPYLVIMKLASSRVQDLADITRMLGAADAAALEVVRAAIRAYAPEALDDVESMILLGRLDLD